MLTPYIRFKGQNASKSISAGASPQIPLRELTALPKQPYWI